MAQSMVLFEALSSFSVLYLLERFRERRHIRFDLSRNLGRRTVARQTSLCYTFHEHAFQMYLYLYEFLL